MTLAPIALQPRPFACPVFRTVPFGCYVIRQDYDGIGALVGGSAIYFDDTDPVELKVEASGNAAGLQSESRYWLLGFFDEPIDFAQCSWSTWEAFVSFPALEEVQEYYGEINGGGAGMLTMKGRTYGYGIQSAYADTLAWNNMPTLIEISSAVVGTYYHEISELEVRTQWNSSMVCRPSLHRPQAFRNEDNTFPVNNPTHGFAIEPKYFSGAPAGVAVWDMTLSFGDYWALGPDGAGGGIYPRKGWAHFYMVP